MPSDEAERIAERIIIRDIERFLVFRTKEVWERQLHPNGAQIETYVDCYSSCVPFPSISLTLYANGTWEYTDPALRDEVEEDE